MTNPTQKKNPQEIGGFLKGVEIIGNKLPHPAILFFILSLIVIVVSHIAASQGMTVTYFDARAKAEVTKKAVSLLNGDGLRYMFDSATKNYTGFAPLGTVLVAMLGVGVAEWSGLFNTSLKKLLMNANPRFLTPIVVFAGVMSNIASDAGYVIVVPIGAMIFAMAGRHPLAGMAAAFAGVSGGFSANLLIGTTDPLLTGITNQALIAAGIDMVLDPTCNWYFLAVSTILLTVVGTFVTDRIVEKNLGTYTGVYKPDNQPVTPLENKALGRATLALLAYVVLMAFLMFPENAVFRTLEKATGEYTLKAFMHNGLIPAILLLFLILVECIRTSRKAKDLSGTLICCGMAGLIAFQSFLNISVATGILPNTGTPLPFVSYGLTSLVTLYIGMGLVLNVGLQNRDFVTRNYELLRRKTINEHRIDRA